MTRQGFVGGARNLDGFADPHTLCGANVVAVFGSASSEGPNFGVHVPKGYIYAAMAFSAAIEALNIISRGMRAGIAEKKT